MHAFITGSRAYGTPKPDSDVDLVVRCDEDTLATLTELADEIDQRNWGEPLKKYDDGTDTVRKSLRFGNLNLIICTDDKRYSAFMLGTEVLKARDAAKDIFDDDVSRDEAVELLTSLRNLK